MRSRGRFLDGRDKGLEREAPSALPRKSKSRADFAAGWVPETATDMAPCTLPSVGSATALGPLLLMATELGVAAVRAGDLWSRRRVTWHVEQVGMAGGGEAAMLKPSRTGVIMPGGTAPLRLDCGVLKGVIEVSTATEWLTARVACVDESAVSPLIEPPCQKHEPSPCTDALCSMLTDGNRIVIYAPSTKGLLSAFLIMRLTRTVLGSLVSCLTSVLAKRPLIAEFF
jgi:hypothetical protein